jgi:maltooligosyltrehalose trehalohydrolase
LSHLPDRPPPIGCHLSARGAEFRVWAPAAHNVRAVFPDQDVQSLDLTPSTSGYFVGSLPAARAGTKYFFELDGHTEPWPDPASQLQPAGPTGPSEIIDPKAYAWQDRAADGTAWQGPAPAGHIFYELHIGTFTREGTWAAAREQLAELAALGITVLEIMPIAEFSGRFGWSYDPVGLFAPFHGYGPPVELCRFIDEAHRLGIAVILDVVYNHFSRLGEQLLRPFSPDYFSQRHQSEWGASPNFDGPQSEAVREYFLANAAYWISQYHFDGLRIDATQAFKDDSPRSILLELCQTARAAAPDRRVLVVGENEPQQAELLRDEGQGGFSFDNLWNDDFHHSVTVRLTGQREAYYSDYSGRAEELIASAKWGYLFQGQYYAWQKKPRGTPALDVPARKFLNYMQNHDQLANSADGRRIDRLTSPGRLRAMTALWLLAPQTPMLFQGQEFAASSPFFYFNDCQGVDATEVHHGRSKFLSQFPSLNTPQMQALAYDPCDEQNFQRCKLDFADRSAHLKIYHLHRDLLKLRRDDPVFSQHDAQRLHGVALSSDTLALRFLGSQGQTRLLLVNFGGDLCLNSISHPLLAPPEGMHWETLWSSDDPAYDGRGTPDVDTAEGWRIPGEAAVALEPARREERS